MSAASLDEAQDGLAIARDMLASATSTLLVIAP